MPQFSPGASGIGPDARCRPAAVSEVEGVGPGENQGNCQQWSIDLTPDPRAR